jgi:predicted 2-oxoglutarate/Fe(II)-dependent dioxygenase YbiX
MDSEAWTVFFQVQELMPEWYEKLTWCLDILPHFEQTIAAPFLGFVVNINVMTRGHRDGKDLEACVVMPIGDFEGGELVLAELGLVVELKNGDVIIFPSHKLTHFNLHYKGTRASFVFHTDASAIKFVEDHNGWTLV